MFLLLCSQLPDYAPTLPYLTTFLPNIVNCVDNLPRLFVTVVNLIARYLPAGPLLRSAERWVFPLGVWPLLV